MQNKVSGVILASGLSKRMGQNKLLLHLFDKMLFEHVILACKNSFLQDFVVVTSYDIIKNYCKKNEISVIFNENNTNGQSESIKLGTKYFEKSEAIMFLTADAPLIKKENINFLINEYNGNILVPFYKNKRTTPTIFPNRYFSKLLKLENDDGGKKVIDTFEKIDVDFENFDIDTFEDYDKIRKENLI